MSEVYTNPFTTTLSAAYTAGDTSLHVAAVAPTAVQTGTFRVRLGNTSNTLLKVTGGASTTTWTVVAEANDANAPSGANVYGCEATAGFIDAILQQATGLNGILLDTTVAWTDGMTLQYNATTGKLVPVFDRATRPTSAVPGKPSAGQLVMIYTAEASELFPANFASPNSYGTCGTNPTATAVYTVSKNGSTVGTISISTGGAFTFSTTSGTTFTLNAGDRLTVTAPSSQDATLADVGITLVGTRGTVSSTVVPSPIFTWKGAWSSSTAYNTYDVVTLSGSTYVCILQNTNHTPPNATYWNLMASAGSSGGVQVAQDIGGTTSLPTVIGLQGVALDSATISAPSDGQTIKYNASAGKYKATDICSEGTFASLPTAGNKGLIYIPTDARLMCRDTGSAWEYFALPRIYPPSLVSGWGWINQGQAAISTSNGIYAITTAPTSSTNLNCYVKATPATPYKIWTRFQLAFSGANSGNWFGGLIWIQSSNNNGQMYGLRSNMDLMAYSTGAVNSPSFTPLYEPGASPAVLTVSPINGGAFCLGLEDDGTNRKLVLAPDGYNSVVIYSQSRTTTITPDKVGIFIKVDSGGSALLSLESWYEH